MKVYAIISDFSDESHKQRDAKVEKILVDYPDDVHYNYNEHSFIDIKHEVLKTYNLKMFGKRIFVIHDFDAYFQEKLWPNLLKSIINVDYSNCALLLLYEGSIQYRLSSVLGVKMYNSFEKYDVRIKHKDIPAHPYDISSSTGTFAQFISKLMNTKKTNEIMRHLEHEPIETMEYLSENYLRVKKVSIEELANAAEYISIADTIKYTKFDTCSEEETDEGNNEQSREEILGLHKLWGFCILATVKQARSLTEADVKYPYVRLLKQKITMSKRTLHSDDNYATKPEELMHFIKVKQNKNDPLVEG